jgi:PAS domain S-box-containing protein
MPTGKVKDLKHAVIAFVSGVVIWVMFVLNEMIYVLPGTGFTEAVSAGTSNPVFWFFSLIPFLVTSAVYRWSFTVRKKLNKKSAKLNRTVENSKNLLGFVQSMITGNNNISLDQGDQSDELTRSLVKLQEHLNDTRRQDEIRRKEDEQRRWTAEGLARFGDILRENYSSIEELSFNIISNLVKYTGSNQGAVYILYSESGEERYFDMTACYAYERKKYADRRIEYGEGLVGACALEMEKIYMTEIPEEYLNITSGLGQANPRCLLLMPLNINETNHGVLEIASFYNLEQYKIDFVEKVAESVASTISTAKINMRTSTLLKESQEQAKALAEQEEQMRQNMEELQATQEEAARYSEEFVSFTNSVNQTLIRAEYDISGTLLYANTKFLNKLGYSGSEEVEGQHISIFVNEKDREWFDPIWDNLVKGGRHFEGYMKHVTKGGQELWTMATYTCVRNNSGETEKILCLAIDTTEQKKQSLDYEGQLAALNLSNLKAEYSIDGELINANDKFMDVLQYSAEEVNGITVFDILEKDERETFQSSWDKLLAGNSYGGQIKVTTRRGESKWLRGTFSAAKDMYGDIAKIIFIASEITKEKQMEMETIKQTELLKDQEEKLRNSRVELRAKLKEAKEEMKQQFKEIEKIKLRNERTLEGALDAIVTINQAGVIQFFNKASEELWNYSKDDILGKSVSMLFSEQQINDDEFIRSYVSPGAQKTIGQRKEASITDRDGEEKPVLFLLSEAIVDNEHTYTAFIQNIEVELF